MATNTLQILIIDIENVVYRKVSIQYFTQEKERRKQDILLLLLINY